MKNGKKEENCSEKSEFCPGHVLCPEIVRVQIETDVK
jgi:hypothetical protein